jgi:hypothetical protein
MADKEEEKVVVEEGEMKAKKNKGKKRKGKKRDKKKK